ncbi:hypothetical protein [Streptomyces sp. NPDC060194]|uniref:hypothetical protein n=1 Tax=Streptomyces sp. NPDC060194 TaxID=3347069 RepID=UPI003650CE3C
MSPDLLAAAHDLQQLARQSPSRTGRKVLSGLAGDAALNARALVGVDLNEVYPPRLLVPDAPPRYRNRIGWLGVLRDVFVFAPIVLTWLSLLEAFRDYSEGETFLDQWRDGFGVWAVGAVVVLILLVMLITVALHWLRLRDRQISSNAKLRQRISELLVVITAEIARPVETPTGPAPSGVLVRTAAEITEATDRLRTVLNDTAERLEKIFGPGPESGFTTALNGWTASASSLERMGKSLTVPHKLVQDFAAMRAALKEDEAATLQTLKDLIAELTHATDTSAESGRNHVVVSEVVIGFSRQLNQSLDRFVDRSELLDRYMQHMAVTLNRLDPRLAQSAPGPGPSAHRDPMDDGFDMAAGRGGVPRQDVPGTSGGRGRDGASAEPPGLRRRATGAPADPYATEPHPADDPVAGERPSDSGDAAESGDWYPQPGSR